MHRGKTSEFVERSALATHAAHRELFLQARRTVRAAASRDVEHAYTEDGGLVVLRGNIVPDGAVIKT